MRISAAPAGERRARGDRVADPHRVEPTSNGTRRERLADVELLAVAVEGAVVVGPEGGLASVLPDSSPDGQRDRGR